SDQAGAYYAVIALNNGCSDLTSSNTAVFVEFAPAALDVDNIAPVCPGDDLVLAVNATGVPLSANFSYEWFDQNGTSLGSTTNSELIIPDVDDSAAGSYYVVMTVGNCAAPPSDVVEVEVVDTEIPNAGTDLEICQANNNYLAALIPANSTGQWTSPTGALIADDENAQTEVTNLSFGENIFIWSLSNGSCVDYAKDTMIIKYSLDAFLGDNCSKPVINDTDGDGILDNVDIDDDNDGIPDKKEYCNTAGDFNCFPSNIDPSGDEDGDLIPNYIDADDATVNNTCDDIDNNGICDALSAIYDTDADNVPDHLDLDSDNDGIPDLIEAGHEEADANMDARIDGLPADFGANGLFNDIATDPDDINATITYNILKTSTSTDTPDHDNIDSDEDGIFDVVESPADDGDYDGKVGTGIPKVDANGIPFEDGANNPVSLNFNPKDLDQDGFPDYRDIDRDNDGIVDSYECPDQTNCIDSDDDGNFDVDELDSDNDGLTDEVECPGGILPCPDSDNDTIDDFREPNCPQLGTPAIVVADDVLCEGEVIALSTDNIAGVGITYEWYFNDGGNNVSLGVTNAPNFFINGTNAGNTGGYAVQIRSGACVSLVSNAVNVVVYPTLDPVATNGTAQGFPACEGQNIQLSVPNYLDATYEWFGPNNFTATVFNPVLINVTADQAGDYYAIVTMSDGCATLVSANTTVFIQAAPAAPTVADVAPVCEGGDLMIVADAVGVPPNVNATFEWFFENGNSLGTTNTATLTIPNVDATANGGYYVIMNLGNCETAPSDTVMVEILSLETPNAGTDDSVCGLGNGLLSATPPTNGTGTWTSPTGATIVDQDFPNSAIGDLVLGENVFVWTLSNGSCENYASDTVIITYTDAATDEAFLGADLTLCDDTAVTLNALNPTTATGTWQQPTAQTQAGVVISDNNSPTPTITGLIPGNSYTFTWSLSQGNCVDYDADQIQVTVSESPALSANVTAEENYACGEEEIQLSATVPSIGTGTWTTTSTASIANSNLASTTADGIEVGANLFIWSLSFEACENYDADTMIVFSEETIEVNDDNYLIGLNEKIENEDVLVNDNIGFVNEYTVNIVTQPMHGTVDMVDGIFTYTPDQNAFGIDEFEYEVCNANCPNACETATVTITLNGLTEKGECWIPNVIAPNGNGKNDALIIPCTENFPNNELMIFNRWGDKVFGTTSYANDWEGTFKGKDLPAGTYYYIFKLDTDDNDPIQGFFTIVR
ncbi:MAG: gliding motility-associated C-terminal domain-containing protein, partial [Bacteroidota bacterium]